jgi:hypothetical protein
LNDFAKVICIDTGDIFDDIIFASLEMKLSIKDILLCCEGKLDNVHGTHWEYSNK